MAQRTVAREFYSARLLHVAIVGDKRPRRRQLCDETVTSFRALNEADALRCALKIGRSRQHQYRNDRGHVVRWVFAEVLAMTRIGAMVDGVEVSSRLHDRLLPKPASLRTRFHPEKCKPQWT
jgi:uncharacterized protein DUF4288